MDLVSVLRTIFGVSPSQALKNPTSVACVHVCVTRLHIAAEINLKMSYFVFIPCAELTNCMSFLIPVLLEMVNSKYHIISFGDL